MINKTLLHDLVSELIQDSGLFIVEISVSGSGKIKVLIDSIEGVKIQECIRISRGIESRFDRDQEDFELEVSSPGLTEPFKVPQQYLKAMGKAVEVQMISGETFQGTLKSFDGEILILSIARKGKNRISKKSEVEWIEREISCNEIRYTRELLIFK